MKDTIKNMFPDAIANTIILSGKFIKKRLRASKRLIKFGHKPFFKKIDTCGQSFYIQLDPVKNGCVDEVIANTGEWETIISQKMKSLLSPGDVFLDIGANIGYHSLFVASLYNQGITVHSFEPINSLATQLKNSKATNIFTNITVHEIALGNTNEELNMNLRDENMGGSSLSQYNDLEIVKTSGTSLIKVKPLDSVFHSNFKVSMIKIDVEGYEFEALKGAEKLLREQKPLIFIEFSPIFYNQDDSEKVNQFIIFLKSLDYSFITMDGVPVKLEQWIKETESPTQIDILCITKK